MRVQQARATPRMPALFDRRGGHNGSNRRGAGARLANCAV